MKSLKDLKAVGGIIPEAPIAKQITFKLDDDQEYTATIYVKRLSIGDHEKLFAAKLDDGAASAHLISYAVMLGEDGKERIPFKDADRLHPNLAKAMIDAVKEVNEPKKS